LILTISSYTVSKLVRFLRHSVCQSHQHTHWVLSNWPSFPELFQTFENCCGRWQCFLQPRPGPPCCHLTCNSIKAMKDFYSNTTTDAHAQLICSKFFSSHDIHAGLKCIFCISFVEVIHEPCLISHRCW